MPRLLPTQPSSLQVCVDQELSAQTQIVSPEWRARPSDAGRTATALAVVLGLLALLAWLYIISQSVGVGSLVALLIGISAALLAVAMAIFACGYYSMRYRLDDDHLTISCLWLREIVPLGRIDGIGSGRRIGERAGVEGLAWRGLSMGHLTRTELDLPKVFGTSLDPNAALVITASHRSYVITPADLEDFKSQLIGKLEALPEEEIEGAPDPSSEGSILPFTSVVGDRVCLGLSAASLVALLVSFAYVAVKLSGLPESIPLHFNAAGTPDFVVSRTDAFRLPFIGTLLLGANTLVTAAVHSWERDAGRIMAAATLFVELVAFISLLRVVQ